LLLCDKESSVIDDLVNKAKKVQKDEGRSESQLKKNRYGSATNKK
jgi:hypothetical protein